MRKSSRASGRAVIGAVLMAGAGLAIGTPAGANSPAARPRPVAFAQCAACHSVEPGRNGIGPSLAAVSGRKAASLPGFNYSSALRNSGLAWDAVSLDRWLASPQRAVPGTRMPFAGISDPTRRKEVVDYLMTLK